MAAAEDYHNCPEELDRGTGLLDISVLTSALARGGSASALRLVRCTRLDAASPASAAPPCDCALPGEPRDGYLLDGWRVDMKGPGQVA